MKNIKYKPLPLILLFSILSQNILFIYSKPFGVGSTEATKFKLYKTLGLSKDCTQDDIKKSYRKLALRNHPDKVPSDKRDEAERKFKQINKAYETLSDEEKRKLYDTYGEQSLDNNFNPNMNFNFGNSQQQQQQKYPFSFDSSSGGGSAGNQFYSNMEGFSMNDLFSTFSSGMGGNSNSNSGPQTFSGSSSSNNLESIFESILKQNNKDTSFKYDNYNNNNSKPTIHSVHCTLEELAKGCTKKLKVTYPNHKQKIYTINIPPGTESATEINYHPSVTKNNNIPSITFRIKSKKHLYFTLHEKNDLLWKCQITKQQAKKDSGLKLTIPLPTGETFICLTKDYISNVKNGDKIEIVNKGMPIIVKKNTNNDNSDFHKSHRGKLIIEFHVI